MAMSLLLRNAPKINAAGLVKTARLTPLRTLTTKANSVGVLMNAIKPAALLKTAQPLAIRNISLSAPRMASSGNYSAIWTFERLVSLGLLLVIPAAFLVPSKLLDTLMAISIVLHTHWGIEAMVTDYLRPSLVGHTASRAAHATLLLLSVATLAGLFYTIFNDVGLAQHIRNLWTIQPQ